MLHAHGPLLTVDVGERTTTETDIDEEETVGLSFDYDNLYIFDRESGDLLTKSTGTVVEPEASGQ